MRDDSYKLGRLESDEIPEEEIAEIVHDRMEQVEELADELDIDFSLALTMIEAHNLGIIATQFDMDGSYEEKVDALFQILAINIMNLYQAGEVKPDDLDDKDIPDYIK